MKAIVGMRTLYLRIWLTVIVSLALFAIVSGWIVQRHLDDERQRNQAVITERVAAWGDLIQRSLPAASAPAEVQAQALREWSQRLRVPMALDDESGHRIVASDSFLRREAEPNAGRQPAYQIRLDDGRALWVMRPGMLRPPPPDRDGRPSGGPMPPEDQGPPPAAAAAAHPPFASSPDGGTVAAGNGADGPNGGRSPHGPDGSNGWNGAMGAKTGNGADGAHGGGPGTGASRIVPASGATIGAMVGAAGPSPGGRPDADGEGDGGPPPQRRFVGIDVRGPLPSFPFLPLPRGFPPGISLTVLVLVLFLAVAAGAYPVVRRLTRRLETLQRGVEAFGAGALDRRVPIEGRDEVAAVAASFNRTAERIEALVRSNRSLLANASHELRSPLARLKMATSMLRDAATPAEREHLRAEIDTDIGELDALVDEVLLASRLEASAVPDHVDRVDLLALAVEEGARVGATVDGLHAAVQGEERLLRRALRNLLENARRYGGGEVRVLLRVADRDAGAVEVVVSDNGPGVPEAYRERVFEPFFRLPGHAEREGGVGLGLSLVRQIVERHGGRIRIESPAEGGGCFIVTLPRLRERSDGPAAAATS